MMGKDKWLILLVSIFVIVYCCAGCAVDPMDKHSDDSTTDYSQKETNADEIKQEETGVIEDTNEETEAIEDTQKDTSIEDKTYSLRLELRERDNRYALVFCCDELTCRDFVTELTDETIAKEKDICDRAGKEFKFIVNEKSADDLIEMYFSSYTDECYMGNSPYIYTSFEYSYPERSEAKYAALKFLEGNKARVNHVNNYTIYGGESYNSYITFYIAPDEDYLKNNEIVPGLPYYFYVKEFVDTTK